MAFYRQSGSNSLLLGRVGVMGCALLENIAGRCATLLLRDIDLEDKESIFGKLINGEYFFIQNFYCDICLKGIR